MNSYYRKVPPALRDEFLHFRQEHPARKVSLHKVPWEYISSGDPASPALLLLPGALSTAESAWRTFSMLEQKSKYHLLCPDYPIEVDSMTALADGLQQLLVHESLGTSYVVGGSYGGMLAQVLTHRHPGIVSRLVLSHTYPPVPSRAHSVEPALRLFRVLPMFIVKKMLRDRMTGILPSKPTPDLQLVAAQVRETVDTRLTRDAALNTFLRMMDFDRQAYTPANLSEWPGKTLILLAEDDPTTPPALRQALVDLYPHSRLHLFKGSGHATAILESDEYIRLIDSFLSEP